ncbi:hypothetical protein BE08_25860 [Sorangium cellulosum]|uniref:Uncharacterized protein n=1 Tax=Sorangium cellulosum TaxID=56 RepID=A0A150PQI3_SORCE|nr:hypothetical protein BE08_25860 [Sorangium cellulosum]
MARWRDGAMARWRDGAMGARTVTLYVFGSAKGSVGKPALAAVGAKLLAAEGQTCARIDAALTACRWRRGSTFAHHGPRSMMACSCWTLLRPASTSR